MIELSLKQTLLFVFLITVTSITSGWVWGFNSGRKTFLKTFIAVANDPWLLDLSLKLARKDFKNEQEAKEFTEKEIKKLELYQKQFY